MAYQLNYTKAMDLYSLGKSFEDIISRDPNLAKASAAFARSLPSAEARQVCAQLQSSTWICFQKWSKSACDDALFYATCTYSA